jgi:hypothetical protein
MADDKTQVSQSGASEDKLSPRQKGVRQGVMLMLLSVILIPAYILLAPLFPANDRLVESSVSDTPFEKISQAILFTIFMFGLARVLYAYFFQQDARLGEREPEAAQLGNPSSDYALPPAQSIPVSGFGAWRAETGATVQSSSATEQTTAPPDKE